jgi:hypothetical protein
VGQGGQIPHPGAGGDELHVWDQPPRVIHVGGGDRPTSGGSGFEELALSPGVAFQWRGTSYVYGRAAVPKEEIEIEQVEIEQVTGLAAAPAVHRSELTPADERVWKRLKAGMYVELGLADRVTSKRWQDAVVSHGFDPDRCASEILARSAVADSESRVLERSGRLLRDLLMAPLLSGTRGATRRARQATRGVVAMVLTQALAFVAYTTILLVALLLLRIRGVSLDGFFDLISGQIARLMGR